MPPHTVLEIHASNNPTHDLMTINIDSTGKPSISSIVAAISTFNCTVGPPASLPAGLTPAELRNNPAFVSKVRNAIIDMLASVQYVLTSNGTEANSTGKSEKLEDNTETLKKLGLGQPLTAACPFANSGWRMALRGACGSQTMYNGTGALTLQVCFVVLAILMAELAIDSGFLQLEIVANRTRCLKSGQQPYMLSVGSYFTVIPPKGNLTTLTVATPANNIGALKTATEFSQDDQLTCSDDYDRLDSTRRNELHDAINVLGIALWRRLDLTTSCGAYGQEAKANATFKALSACVLDREFGETTATEHLMRVFIAVPCLGAGRTMEEFAAFIEGNVTTFAYYHTIYQAEVKNISFAGTATTSRRLVEGEGAPVAEKLPRQRVKINMAKRDEIVEPAVETPANAISLPRLGGNLFKRAEDSNAACLNGICSFVLSAMDKAITDNPILDIPIPGIGNLLNIFKPSKFLAAKAGATICSMTVKGSDLGAWASVTNPATAWLGTVAVPVISDAASWYDMFLGLPVDPNTYYGGLLCFFRSRTVNLESDLSFLDRFPVLGFYTTQVPGVEYPPTIPNMQIASAISICTGDFLFSFAGLEVEIIWLNPPMTITVSLDAMGFSVGGKIQASALGFTTSFWAPSGFQTLDITGQTYMTGTVSTSLGNVEVDPVIITLSATGTVMINADPAKNGLAKTDVSLGVQVDASPSITLLNGLLTLDLSSIASASVTLIFNVSSGMANIYGMPGSNLEPTTPSIAPLTVHLHDKLATRPASLLQSLDVRPLLRSSQHRRRDR